MSSIEKDYARLLDTVTKVTADLACEVLNGAGIPCLQHGPDFDMAELGAAAHGFVRGVSVFVPKSAVERARAILVETWGEEGLPG